jgi:hypothetical protein
VVTARDGLQNLRVIDAITPATQGGATIPLAEASRPPCLCSLSQLQRKDQLEIGLAVPKPAAAAAVWTISSRSH